MRFLVTRPLDDAEATALHLAPRGIKVLIEPLIDIQFLDGPALNLNGVQALLITSANGIRAFCARDDRRDLPVMAVGDASAHWARRAGFSHVETASGDVDALADMVIRTLDPKEGVLLHPAGSKVAGDLAGLLEDEGFTYRREVLYEAKRADTFSEMAEAQFKTGGLDGVMLYSPRTAKTLVDIVNRMGLAEACREITAFCLSDNVATEIKGLEWRSVVVADRPEQPALMAAIDGWREDLDG